jgi:hypothetical protein
MIEITTVIISVLAIIIAYLSMIAKKPRVYFKLKSIYNYKADSYFLNLEIVNCGDKPAFNININPKNKIDEHIEFNSEIFGENLRYYYNLKSFNNCFNHTTKFIEGSGKEHLYIGEIGHLNGDIKRDFKINAEIVFYEEFNLSKIINKTIILIDWFFSNKFLIMFNFLAKKIGYQYNVSMNTLNKEHKYQYEYSFLDMYLAKAVIKNTQYSNCKILFEDHLYKIWEESLTKDELKYFNKYKMEFLYDTEKYIVFLDEINKEKYSIFYKKYLIFLKIMMESDILNYENKQILKKTMEKSYV